MASAGAEPSGARGSIGKLMGAQKVTSSEGPSSSRTMSQIIGHRGIDPTGETTYKKTTSSALKGAIQFGISHTVGSLSQKPERDVLMQDFEVVESISFPKAGSNLTSPHHYSNFRFKTYAPVAFRYFRDMFGIQPGDYLYSLCNEPLIELWNSGASGSLFYVSSDDEFIIKTVQHKEAEFLQKLLPGYFMNLNQNKRTLLPKFYGLYCVQAMGKNIRIVVMNNLLPRAVQMHLKYDLKGSTYKRQASANERGKAIPTYKDLDFIQDMPDGVLLDTDKYNALNKTIHRDCLLLQSFKIIDYSLLVGIHNVDLACQNQASDVAGALDQRRPQGQKHLYSTAIEAIQGVTGRMRSLNTEDQLGGIPAQNTQGERLLVYIGIIDILQSYICVKKLEHSWKAMLHDGDTVSVHRPGFYAERFERFMCNTVFRKITTKASPSKKSRAGARGNLQKANATASGPSSQNPTSSSSQQPAVQHYISSENEMDTEGNHNESDGGLKHDFGRPDPLPEVLTHNDITKNIDESMLCNSSLSSTSLALENLSFLSMDTCKSVEVQVSESSHTLQKVGTPQRNNFELIDAEDVISLNDQFPKIHRCHV